MFSTKFFFISISIISIVNTHTSQCIYFNNNHISPINYCEIYTDQNLRQLGYNECLNCYIRSQYKNLINAIQCKNNLHCIQFQFSNNTLFETFFRTYSYLFKDLYQISTNRQIINALYIKIEHDQFKELNFEYIQSILKSDGIYYSHLYFTLSSYRTEILLDLEINHLKIPLTGILIQIYCNNSLSNYYNIDRYQNSTFHSTNCVIIKKKSKSSTMIYPNSSSVSINLIRKSNIILFISGLIAFFLWIICLFSCLYLKYYKWKDNNSFNQRSSIVSSIFSTDSFDSRKDEILYPEENKQDQVTKQFNQRALYSLDNDF